jgi:hypothetical protein
LRSPWEDAQFAGRVQELEKLKSQIQSLRAEKALISSRWSESINRVTDDLTGLNEVYLPDLITEINLILARLEKFFDFNHEDRTYDGKKDSYRYKIFTNAGSIDRCREKLISARVKIARGKSELFLRELLTLFDDSTKEIPTKFPLDEGVEGNQETLRSFRDRKESSLDKLKFPQEEWMYSLNNYLGVFAPKR